jgi:hypothetical protein
VIFRLCLSMIRLRPYVHFRSLIRFSVVQPLGSIRCFYPPHRFNRSFAPRSTADHIRLLPMATLQLRCRSAEKAERILLAPVACMHCEPLELVLHMSRRSLAFSLERKHSGQRLARNACRVSPPAVDRSFLVETNVHLVFFRCLHTISSRIQVPGD